MLRIALSVKDFIIKLDRLVRCCCGGSTENGRLVGFLLKKIGLVSRECHHLLYFSDSFA